jgi:MFS family permease
VESIDNTGRNSLDTGVIGPVTTMASFEFTFGNLPSALHGIVVSCLLLAATFASLFAGALSDRFGRPRAIAIGCLTFGIGAAIETGASSLDMFIAGRCIVGVGEGLFLSTLVVYALLFHHPIGFRN